MDPLLKDVLDDLLKNPLVSDIILCPDEPVSYFHLGELHRHSLIATAAIIEEICRESEMSLERKDDDGRWTVGSVKLRCNLLYTGGKPQLCLRPMPRELPTFDTCDFPERDSVRKPLLESDDGIVLFSGRAGSGKSKSCAALIHERALRRKEHIITLEDPPEYEFPRTLPSLISQRHLGSDVADPKEALKSAVRQYPRMLFVGEVRDGETARHLLDLASTGVFVVTTTHARSAHESIEAFLKFLPSELWQWGCFMLSQHLRAVIAQRLLVGPDMDRRFVLHQVLGRTDTVAQIIGNAAKDPNSLRNLEGEIAVGGDEGPHVTWDYSLQRWRRDGVRLDIAA